MAGKVQSIPSEEQIRQMVNKAIADANIKVGGVTFGKVEHGQMVGKMDACYGVIATRAGVNEYEVPHVLGHVPGFCMLIHSENRVTQSQYNATSVSRDKWSDTTCRVNVSAAVGSLDGGELTFWIGGSR